MASALRYIDLALLAAGLPVFIAADLPMAAYVVVAGIWIVTYAIELGADRAIARAGARGDKRAAMGWLGASTLARVWVIALAVLLVGLSSKPAGLAAAVFAAILFTVHLGTRVLLRVLEPDEEARAG